MLSNLKFLCVLTGILWFAGCGDFSSSPFNQIQTTMLRVIDFEYRNYSDTTICEAMPGDTMQVRAYFAGEKITSLSWKVSFNVYKTQSSDTALEIQDLDYSPVTINTSGFSPATQCVGIQFTIPDSILYKSATIQDTILNSFNLTRRQVLGHIDSLIHFPGMMQPSFLDTLLFLNAYTFLQIFSVPVRLFVKVNGLYPITSDFTVRYNRFFSSKIHTGYVNHNPVIHFITLYKIKNPLPVKFTLDSMRDSDTTYCFYQSPSLTAPPGKNILRQDTILVDDSYTYFIATDTGVIGNGDQRDTCVTFFTNAKLIEIFRPLWFYELDKNETDGVDDNSKLSIGEGERFLTPFSPPSTKKITYATLWIQVYDRFRLGESFRPDGSTVKEKIIYFKYK